MYLFFSFYCCCLSASALFLLEIESFPCYTASTISFSTKAAYRAVFLSKLEYFYRTFLTFTERYFYL